MRRPASGRRKARLLGLVCAAVATAAALGIAEAALRWRGERPFRVIEMPIEVEPGGRLFTSHPTLGYSHLPGRFVVTFPTGLATTVTHGPDTLRITGPPAPPGAPTRRQVWVFGCSFTHGWSLSDEQTYPWLLQRAVPDYEVVNFGVSGYGTVHSLIQFREALGRRPPPAVAVIAYASFQDERNTFGRHRRKAIVPWNRLGPLDQPYARLDRDRRARYALARVEYRELPLQRRSALVHRLERAYNDLEAGRLDAPAVTRAVLDDFTALAEARGVRLVVAGISQHPRTRELLAELAQRGLPTVDIAVDLTDPANLNRPHSQHPGPRANQRFAERLAAYLTVEVLRRP